MIDHFISFRQCRNDLTENPILLKHALLAFDLLINVKHTHDDVIPVILRAHHVQRDITALASQNLPVDQGQRTAAHQAVHQIFLVQLVKNAPNIIGMYIFLDVFRRITEEIVAMSCSSQLRILIAGTVLGIGIIFDIDIVDCLIAARQGTCDMAIGLDLHLRLKFSGPLFLDIADSDDHLLIGTPYGLQIIVYRFPADHQSVVQRKRLTIAQYFDHVLLLKGIQKGSLVLRIYLLPCIAHHLLIEIGTGGFLDQLFFGALRHIFHIAVILRIDDKQSVIVI